MMAATTTSSSAVEEVKGGAVTSEIQQLKDENRRLKRTLADRFE